METLSLFTAFCYSLSSVLVRKGLEESTPYSASIIGSMVQTLILSILLLHNMPTINWEAVTFFALSGFLASNLGRLFNYLSVERLGVALSSSIIGGSPLISTALAIIILGEKSSLTIILGTILVVSGITVISSRRGRVRIRGKNMIFPLLSAVLYGASTVVRKIGLNIQSEAILGAQIGAFTGFLSFLITVTATDRLGELKANIKSLLLFASSGVIVSAGWIAMFTAMQNGTVSIVATLIGAYPLFSLLLSYFMLRGEEDISTRVILGSIMVVMGVVLVTLF
ncbi:MAG: DMT family transporter [Candidatus Bathyarchaeia archaeon]